MNNKKIISSFILAGFLTSLSANSPIIFEEQKIRVFNVPHNEVDNLNSKKIKEYTSTTPLYSVSQALSPDKTMIRTKDENVVLVINKNRNPILNYNDMLMVLEKYAQDNIPMIDKQRISNTLKSAKIQTTYQEEKYKNDNNEELIVAIKENKDRTTKKAKSESSTGIDFSSLSLMDTINYFIDNYQNINKNMLTDLSKDTRYHLVKNIKNKVIPYSKIDASAVEYSITLEELKLLKNTIINYN